MCGRYITGEGIYELVIDELGIGETVFPYFPEGDINPGSIVPVIAEGGYGLEFHEAFWGFPGKDASLVINARSPYWQDQCFLLHFIQGAALFRRPVFTSGTGRRTRFCSDIQTAVSCILPQYGTL